MMKKIGLKNYFEIPPAPSDTCKPARPIQPFWTDFSYWAAAALKGLLEFFLDHYLQSSLSSSHD